MLILKIFNGDIICPDTAAQALRGSGLGGVMVGPGNRGEAWRLAQIRAAIMGDSVPQPQDPTPSEIIDIVPCPCHWAALLAFCGAALRREIFTRADARHVMRRLRDALSHGRSPYDEF